MDFDEEEDLYFLNFRHNHRSVHVQTRPTIKWTLCPQVRECRFHSHVYECPQLDLVQHKNVAQRYHTETILWNGQGQTNTMRSYIKRSR